MSNFTREHRYYVIKIKDAEYALTQAERDILSVLNAKVSQWRIGQGKTPIQGVFVEHDWPEHDGVWAAIEQRIANEAVAPTPVPWCRPHPPKEPLVWPDLICEHDWVATVKGGHKTCIYCKKSELIEFPA